MPCLTLLTDFGLDDSYVGTMKAIILAIAPHITLVDLTHHIAPQDRWAARFNLMNAVPYCPAGSIHLAVVDPGVGGDRRAIAIQHPCGTLVGPDNGIFSGVLDHWQQSQAMANATGQTPAATTALQAVTLTRPAYWRVPNPSHTFHGRDIFAPVAAHLALGTPITAVGEAIDPASLHQLPLPPLQHQDDGLIGHIQHVDGFGNLITTLPAACIGTQGWSLAIRGLTVAGAQTYASVSQGALVALVGSHGWLELAVNGGRASDRILSHLAQLKSPLDSGDRPPSSLQSHTTSPLLGHPITLARHPHPVSQGQS